LKPTAVSVDKEATRWSLSWQPDGCCNSFTREAILASAPVASGVYGLFNFDCQIFIGASVNIREALLRHASETDFQSQHLRPTGFTFEPCAPELSKSKVDELIAKFRPVLQVEAALTEPWTLSSNPSLIKDIEDSKTSSDHHEFPIHESERQPKVRRRFQFNRLGTLVAGIIIASALVMFYFSVPADYTIQKRANGANPAPVETKISLGSQKMPSSIDGPVSISNRGAKPTTKSDVRTSASTQNVSAKLDAKNTAAARVPPARSPQTQSAKTTNLDKKWSVQISAVPAKETADSLVQQLKAKGFDSYLVQTDVKGQTYYRVRVGHFDAREEAEALRQSLARQESYRDAYLTGD
jgi:cell division septation protein DedD